MAAKPDIWMPLYIGDYLAATSHLDALESGAYLHLLMHAWRNGNLPAPGEMLRRIAKVHVDAWSNAWAVLEPFFDMSTGTPVQRRLEEIRTECNARKDKAQAKAAKGAAVRWSKHAPSISQALPNPCPSSSSSSSSSSSQEKTKTTPQAAFVLPDWIEAEDWAAYMDVRKAKKAAHTPRALNAVVKRLAELKARGHPASVVLGNSVRSGWTDVYEPKGDGNGTNQHVGGYKTRSERNIEAYHNAARRDQEAAAGVGGDAANDHFGDFAAELFEGTGRLPRGRPAAGNGQPLLEGTRARPTNVPPDGDDSG